MCELQAVADILLNGHPRKDRVCLKDHNPLNTPTVYIVIKDDRSRSGLIKTGYKIYQSRLSAAGWPNEAHNLSLFENKVHIRYSNKAAASHSICLVYISKCDEVV